MGNINESEKPILTYTCVLCGDEFSSKVKEVFCPACEDDEDNGKDEDFYHEQHESRMELRAASCECGAWQMTKTGEVVHVADCCCGAE